MAGDYFFFTMQSGFSCQGLVFSCQVFLMGLGLQEVYRYQDRRQFKALKNGYPSHNTYYLKESSMVQWMQLLNARNSGPGSSFT